MARDVSPVAMFGLVNLGEVLLLKRDIALGPLYLEILYFELICSSFMYAVEIILCPHCLTFSIKSMLLHGDNSLRL